DCLDPVSDSRFGLSLGKPETAEAPNHLLAHCYRARRRRLGVALSVSTRESQLRRGPACDRKLPRVQRGMVAGAQRDEVVGLVGSALCPRAQVMDIEELSVGAARHDTTPVVAVEDVAAHGRRNSLGGSRRA